MDKFRRLSEQTLAELKKRRESLDSNIDMIEQGLKESPYVSHLDYEAIRLEAERASEFLKQCEQKRSL